MEPTTITTIVLILIGVVALGMAAYCWLSDWEPRSYARRPLADAAREAEIQAAIAKLRRDIESYEERQREDRRP